MFQIKLEGVDDLLARLDGMARQLPYAIANGVNKMAEQIMEVEKTEMRRVFDRPSPFTINSLRVWRSRWPNLTARVYFKDPPNLSQREHYLEPQVQGGSRRLKPFEVALGRRFAMPGKAAVLNQYGNLTRGQVTKIMSQTGSFREGGAEANRTRKGNKAGDMLLISKQRGKLLPGVYQRVSSAGQITRATTAAAGAKNQTAALRKSLKSQTPRALRPVLIFPSKAPTYRPRFDFFGVARRYYDANIRRIMGDSVQAEMDRQMAYLSSRGMR